MHFRPGVVDVAQDLPGRLDEGGALIGERQVSAAPVEQLHTQLPFQIPDRLGQRRLGDVERMRCLGDAAMVDDGDEIGDQAEVHTGNHTSPPSPVNRT